MNCHPTCKNGCRWIVLGLLVLAGCKSGNTPTIHSDKRPQILVLENEQTDHWLQSYVQILKDTLPGYTIGEITTPEIQNLFTPFREYNAPFENSRNYWGKLRIENRMADANQHTEWVLTFNSTWTTLDIFLQDEDGTWVKQPNGAFTPDSQKPFLPTARGNLVKLGLPPNQVVTVYFRGMSERKATYPSFYIRLKHIDTYYDELLKAKAGNAMFMGFLLMMFFYNLIVYFYGRDRSFLYYSLYLLMVVVYAAYVSDDLVDWTGLFSENPAYQRFTKLSLYFAMMLYLAFIRSFLDLTELLPTWDKILKGVIYLGFPLVILNVVVLLTTNFSFVIEDRITVPYICLMVVICCGLIYPLLKSKDIKGYFVIAGISAITIGSFLTVISLLWVPPFSLFYLKAGTIVEVIIFSLGLAYRQRQQKVAQQQADFQLKESRLIQEKKELEALRLKELNDFKTRFYTNITHEFRTPLTVIMGITENIKAHKQEKTLIKRNGKNLLKLINQLLDLSKLETGKLELQKVHRNIIVYLQYLTESFYSAATQKNIRLFFHSEEEMVTMDFDPEKVQQIVYNLLSNALKFTPEYGKVIFHASKVEENGTAFLKLKVKDTGIGIPAESVGLIFDQFYQIEQTGSTGGTGTGGIGLALTKELVELMDGRISVESQVGKGSSFIIYLPIESQSDTIDVPDMTPDEITSEAEITNSDSTAPVSLDTAISHNLLELLIIEDNEDIITYIKSIVKENHLVHTALNGRAGIEKALEIIPDIIICDVMMPEKNGYEVCQTLKQDERTSHIPIILLTARSTQSDKVEGLKYGADAYLTKPFDKEELLIRLKKLVESRQKLQQYYAGAVGESLETETSADDVFLQKLREQIQLCLSDEEFGVLELSKAAGMSQMQIYRKLKALTGKTPSQFIRSYRLEKGLELIQEGELNISEVAYKTGFTDPSYFSRVFKQEFGKNPSDLLK